MKDILKEIKLNESTISMALGVFIVLVAGVLIISQFRDRTPQIIDLNTGIRNDIEVNNSPEESENIYTVAEGDSLWSISEDEYGTGYEWTKIAEANNITGSGQIEVGQKIVIPSASSISGGEILDEAASTEGAQPTINQPTSEYVVVHGDTLWDISIQVYGTGYRWTDIAQANNLVNPNIIHAGNVFTLPS